MEDNTTQRFSEVLAALVAGVAQARSATDMEALRIARRYRQNEFLRGLPIPRLRIQRIAISLPIILTELVPGSAAEVNALSTIVEAAAQTYDRGLEDARRHLESLTDLQNVSEKEKDQIAFYAGLLDTLSRLYPKEQLADPLTEGCQQALRALQVTEGGTAPSDAAIREAIGNAVLNVLRALLDEASFRHLHKTKGEEFNEERARQSREEINSHRFVTRVMEAVRLAAEEKAVLKPTVSPDFSVSVNTDQIKNAGGGPNTVTRLNMVLMEEGLEWVTESHDGLQSTTLMPE